MDITVPDMGESVVEATVARWIKQEGDPVSPGEALVELETDKINLEVGAQQAGVLEKILRQPGESVAVGDVLGRISPISGGGVPEPASVPPGVGERPAPVGEDLPAAAATPAAAAAPVAPTASTAPAASAVPAVSAATATPVAARMAQDLGVDLGQVAPTGAGGRVTKEDVQAFVERAKTAPAAAPAPAQPAPAPAGAPNSTGAANGSTDAQKPPAALARETRVRMSRRRQTIARRLVEAQHAAAMLTTFNEIDMSAVMELRKRRREGFKERYGVDLGFMSFFVKATIGALRAFPNLNAEIAPGPQGDEIVLKHYYDIGIAIGAEEGLVVPVVRAADQMNFAGIESAIRELSGKVKAGALTLEDLRGGTFTITNGGVYGSLMSTPILNPPQVGILGMHAIKERPVAVNGEIVIRPMMYVALSYDHRIVDGREAVQFLVRLKELVEDPEALLFG